jgi:ubiquinone/menaquinone biosynthesis C-methylase UbiE
MSEEMLDRWERAAVGWRKRAGQVRDMGMPVSVWLIDHLELQPGMRVLELAAGPGDTGFLAAELIRPGGTLVCTDAAESMLDIARERAQLFGVDNVEFLRLELEWIDLPTASVDAILCRWGVMLSSDPAAALHEARRVLRPGGRIALAVWDQAALNPWATITTRAITELGHLAPPDPTEPGMFALAESGRLAEMLEAAGFVEVTVEGVDIERSFSELDAYLEETLDLSMVFSEAYRGLDDAGRKAARSRIAELAAPYTAGDGSVRLPGRSIAALANA